MDIKNKPIIKSLILLSVLLVVITSSFAFVILTHEDPDTRIEFSLINQSGQPFTEKDLSGHNSLVYFGFTSCTHVCPVHMAVLSQALKSLDDTGHSDAIIPIFVSVDPERDSPEVLSEFLNAFDKRFVGLTGEREALEAAALSFKTYLEEAPEAADNPPNRQIAHATVVYLLNQNGRVVDYISADKSSDAIAERIRTIF